MDLDPGIDLGSPALQVDSLPAELQGKPMNTGVGSLSLLQQIFPTQESYPGSPALQADYLPAEPQGKPMNTGVDSLSFLKQIFFTQESNWESDWRRLHYRWILYQLSYQGRPSDAYPGRKTNIIDSYH